MTEAYIAQDDAPTAEKHDEIMRSLATTATRVRYGGGLFKTAGSPQWGGREGRGFTIDCEVVLDKDTVVEIDPDAIRLEDVSSEPFHIFRSQALHEKFAAQFSSLSAEALWALLPRGQSVKGGTLRGNFSKLVDRWKAAGQVLTPSGVILQGHEAAIEDVRLEDFGALGGEAFPSVITGALGSPTQDKLAELDPATHVFDLANPGGADVSHTKNVRFTKYRPELSNNQVTVNMIVGSVGRVNGVGEWKHLMRAHCYHETPSTDDLGDPHDNLVQVATIYDALSGHLIRGESNGAMCLYYSDFYTMQRLRVIGGTAGRCLSGVRILLSNTGIEHEPNPPFYNWTPTIEGLKVTQVPVKVPGHAAIFVYAIDKSAVRRITDVTIAGCDISCTGEPTEMNIAIDCNGVSGFDGLKLLHNTVDARYGGVAVDRDIKPGERTAVRLRDCSLITREGNTFDVEPVPQKKGCNPFAR